MATVIQQILDDVRIDLLADGNVLAGGVKDDFWTDAELFGHFTDGAKQMWRKILDLYKGHFVVRDQSSMSIQANNDLVQGVPTGLFRVDLIRPLNIGLQSGSRGLVFKPVDNITHPRYVQAQAYGAVAARQNVVYYCLENVGSPVVAPSIAIAPMLSEDLALYVAYEQTISPTLTVFDSNPIPGESDKALRAYVTAFAKKKVRPDQAPDPEDLSVFATEEASILAALTPRSIQEAETVVGMFEGDDAGYGLSY